MIDKNNPNYQTAVEEAIWNAATDLVPLDISLPMIPVEYHEACRALYQFFTEMLNDMYENPELYMAVGDLQTCIRWFWVWMYKGFEFKDDAFTASVAAYKKYVKKVGKPLLEFMISRYGFVVEFKENMVSISNVHYPYILKAVKDTLDAAYRHYNVNCTDYLTFCDFRALVNYKRTYHDMLALLNREGQAMAEAICEFAMARGIKPVKCTYFKRVEFKKKGKIIFVLVAKGKNLKINIGFAELGGQAFQMMKEVVDTYQDKDEFVRYLRSNLKKCTNCTPGCQKRANPAEIFGARAIFCQNYLRIFQPLQADLHYIFRLIELREMVVDAGLSEPFYPGNG